MNRESHLPFEGAGFLLSYKSHFILGKRLGDNQQETNEVEYMGGKVEDSESPFQTASRELEEELGCSILSSDWQVRAKPFFTWQPFSKKWIWIYRLELTDTEYEKLCHAQKILEAWDPLKPRSLFGARKAISELVFVPKEDFYKYAKKFADTPRSKNRMKDAKAFAAANHIIPGYGVRGFNLVIFEEHAQKF